jgi:phage terminase small subunit
MTTLKPPQDLGPAARAAWGHAVRTLVALGEEPEHSKLLLAALARTVDDQARARAAWKATGYATAKGSTGQPVVHPLWRLISECDDKIVTLSHELGLGPKARRDLRRAVGRPQGAASAPDRRMPGEPPRRRLRTVE